MHSISLRVPQASNGVGRSMPAPPAPGLGVAPRLAPADEAAGVAWYNGASVETRKFWHAVAGSAAPVDAWIAYRDTAGTAVTPARLMTLAERRQMDSLAIVADAVTRGRVVFWGQLACRA